MKTVLAIAPDGGLAASGLPDSRAMDLPGHAYDPFADVWHWTGRTPYEPAPTHASMLLQRRPTDWQPADPQAVSSRLSPERTVTLSESEDTLARRIASLPDGDGCLMAVAAAHTILRNPANGVACATFPDRSRAYIIPGTLEVVPAG